MSLTHWNKNQTVCHPYLANGRWHVLPCLLMGGQCVDLASSKRLVVQLLSTEAEGMELSLGTSQQSPQEQGIQHKNVGSSGEGIGFLPLGHPMVGTSQGSWFVSPFPDVSRGPQGQQEATQNLCLELWLRGHLGDILGQCLPGLG